MAILSTTNVKERLGRALLTAMALALTGCMILDVFSEEEVPFAFPHRLHIEDEGLECVDCHAGVDSEDEPGIPVLAQCMLCHEDLEEEAPPERRIENLFADGKFIKTGLSSISDEVVFSHLSHAEGEFECSACHGGIEESVSIEADVRVSMDDCMQCHSQAAVANECSTCHSEVGQDWEPESHQHHWKKFHGTVVRAGTDRLSDQCSLCHTESTCNICHAEEPPENHSNYWRRRGHPIEARMDRDNCAVCHQPSFCESCHSDAQPISHSGTFGGRRSTHCLSCHFPLRSEGCFTCHKDTSSHLEATPLPSNPPHSPGLNCRLCHGASVPLPHVDKGDECIACHM